MGIGGIGIWQLLIILVIVLLLFGTKKLRGMGGDLGSAIKSFRKAVKDNKTGDAETDTTVDPTDSSPTSGEKSASAVKGEENPKG